MTIGKLIGKPNFEIDTTINVVLFKETEKSLRQIRNTIITPSIKMILNESLDSLYTQIIDLNPPNDQCFLIEGIFGSGKSHFLAFLNTLFDDTIDDNVRNYLWQKIDENFENKFLNLKDKKFLVIPIALHERKKEDLIDIIFREMEKIIFKVFNKNVDLSSPSKYIDFYYNKCSPGTKDDLNKNIPDFDKFNKLDEDDDLDFYRKAELIRESMEKINLQIKDDFKIGDDLKKTIEIILEESFEKTEKVVKRELNIEGIILLIDEFSEYLKSKKKSETDTEGHKRTLASIQIQYLSEFIKGKNIFMFIAGQEALYNLDPLFEKQAQTGGRLKTLQLKYHHFIEIFNELVVPEKKQFKREIKSLFLNLNINFFNDSKYFIYDVKKSIPINDSIFYDCYPFHPKTIELLMNNIFKYATKTRAGLTYTQDFIKKSLNKNENDLITPYSLFDYFSITLNIKETKKFNFLEDFIKQVNSTSDSDFSREDKTLILKILKYIFINVKYVNAEDCLINLFIENKNIDEIEKLLDNLYIFSKNKLQSKFLRRDYNSNENNYNYYIQIRAGVDIEDHILILSQKIKDTELHEYYLSKYYDMVPSRFYEEYIDVFNTYWQTSLCDIKFDDFIDSLDKIAKRVKTLPLWTPKEIDFIELFAFWNLPFKDEYEKFKPDLIIKNFQEYTNKSLQLKDRLLFFHTKPFDDLLISDIKKSLAFDLINSRFKTKIDNWWGSDDIQKKILSNNPEILDFINNILNEFNENTDEIISQLGGLANQFSFQKEMPLYNKIYSHLSNNLKLIGIDGYISTIEKDYKSILKDKLEENIPNFYPNFPNFESKTYETRYINIILNELYKEQNIFEITIEDMTKQKGNVITGIGEKLGIFKNVSDNQNENSFFKIRVSEKNEIYEHLIEKIPLESDMEDNKINEINLKSICKILRKNYGFSLNISRIFLATLLHQDKIQIKDKQKNKIYDNSQVKYVFKDNIRDFRNFLVYQPKKLNKNEILWIFSFFNYLFKNNDVYREKFYNEFMNYEEIDEIKSAKQKILVDMVKNFNLKEIKAISQELKNLIDSFKQE